MSPDQARHLPPDEAPGTAPGSAPGTASGTSSGTVPGTPTDAPAAEAGTALTLTAADGYPLGATLHAACAAPRAHLVVGGATGVPQGFYRRFAQHMAAHGYATLTLDYRGIGRSKPATLRGFRMNFLDWARLDLAAAVERMAVPGRPLFLVGHSFGGQAFGLLPNHGKVTALATFATGAGWHGWMPPLERLRVLAMWRILGPLMTRWTGYLPWSVLRMGEDLPLDVYRQWRRWCSRPRYFFDDPDVAAELAGFAEVRAPIVAYNALDDAWAPPRSRDAFMAGYRNAPWRAVDVDPRAAGTGPIGHMGYFRARAQPLWEQVRGWFDALRPA